MSKRAGAVPEETREGILQAAKNEFSEYGFQGSSLRRICAAAGVTTGALYFFFQGKNDLFETVISGVTVPFMNYMKQHYDEEKQCISKEVPTDNGDGDFQISHVLIDFYFKNQLTWDIVLKHQEHPSVRKFIDTFVDVSAEHYTYIFRMAEKIQKKDYPVDSFAIRQFANMQTDTMLRLISNNFTQQEMTEHSHVVVKMLRGAFHALLSD